MPIQLIREEEKLIYKAEKSEIYYRRISTLRRAKFVKDHTSQGKTDWALVTGAILREVIYGWKTVQRAGVDIAFNPDLIMLLPEDTLTDILGLSGGANPEGVKGKEKN